ncbi:histone deacetylase 4-like isoform X3 [Centruroides vittatus]|uniref:histone deacetylase 4-like isoform X3 n=1 Tax=Centruroides vittatus TaxID=120091 RepID=UPI00350F8754
MEIDRGTDVHFVFPCRKENLNSHNSMEINARYSQLQRTDLGSAYDGATIIDGDMTNSINPALQEQHLKFQQQLLQLKQQQQLQQQLLLQHFHQQQQQLAEHHEKQMQERIKEYLEHQKRLEEEQKIEKERRDKERIEQLKKKEKHEQSAIASSEVKQKLQEFVLNKKHREAAANSANSPTTLRNWHPLLGKYEDDFPPLRKTVDGSSCTNENSPDSPPNGANIHSIHTNSGTTSIQEKPGTSPFHSLTGQGSVSDLTLYSSPSMPNISLGRPPVHNSAESKSLVTTSEAQVRAMAASRLGIPLTSHMLQSSLPFYPALPVIDGEFTPTSPVYIEHRMKVLEQARTSNIAVVPNIYPPGTVITDAQVAQARLHRNIHRPLGRTQSAPLPLGHPMLQPQNLILSPQQSEQLLREKQLFEQQQQHNLLKQHIRQTVLTRAGSKSQVENVEEENEAVMAQEMKDSCNEQQVSPPEVIDLTDGKRKDDNGDVDIIKQHETFFQQQNLMEQPTPQINEGTAFTSRIHMARPLSRALSSPLVALSPVGSPPDNSITTRHTFTTGVVYDSLMLKHQCICGNNSHHPEHGGRLQSIWARLQETGLISRCERIRSRKATLEEIQSCHSETYSLLFGTNPLNKHKLDESKLADLPIKNFVMLPCGGIGVDSDTTWNELHTASAARMAAGCVTELAFKVSTGELKNGFAIVRPPGHHAEYQQAMGFCFFNSVAIAAKQLRQKLKLEKILIVDWDVHHGNGIQQIFYDDPHVLYISLHRHDDGNFFPGTGDLQEVGTDDGIGFNVNIAWSDSLNSPIGDAEYMAAFRTIVMPIAKDFDPDIVLVASGFDAAYGHPAPLGGYNITAACFGSMTKQLMQLANGKVVLALEGGYDLPAICDCSHECTAALLGDDCSPMKEEEISRRPCQAAVDVLQRCIAIQAPHWPCIKRWAHTIGYSIVEAQQKEREVETVTALASLSVAVSQGHLQRTSEEETEEPMDEDQEK